MNAQILAAIIAGCVALLGYPVTNFFTTRREARAKELAFKLDCYQGFLKSFFALANEPSFETQLAFTHSVNVLNLMAPPGILAAVHELSTTYEKGTGRQWKILDEMLYQMRRDILGRWDRIPRGYNFPVLVADTDRFPRPTRKST